MAKVEIKKKVRPGKAPRLTSKQLDEAAQPTAKDIARAHATWQRFARPAWANLLLATARSATRGKRHPPRRPRRKRK